jgi:ParB family chromosome partitioning protein
LANRRKKAARRKKAGTHGLFPEQMVEGEVPAELDRAADAVEVTGGRVLARFRDPLGGHWQLLAAVPIAQVRASAFQRDLSDAHTRKLMGVIEQIGRYLDPIVVIPDPDGGFRTPNGHHRLEALRRLGARSVLVLLVPDLALEFQILALNTEKAPGLKDRSLEAIRLARVLSESFDPKESEFALQFEEAAHLTLGLAYEARARLAGSVYHPVLKKCDGFLDEPLSRSLKIREQRKQALLELDDRVAELVRKLVARGFDSPHLKSFVVARLQPSRSLGAGADFDPVLRAMLERSESFDPETVQVDPLGP